MNFNEVVGVDLIQINVPEIGDYWMLNCLCWGTDMQIVEIVKDKQASTVLETFCSVWVAHYGPPALVVADQGREFIGHQFTDYLGHMGFLCTSSTHGVLGRTGAPSAPVASSKRDLKELSMKLVPPLKRS